VDVLYVVAIVGSGLFAGGALTYSLAMAPALRRFEPATEFAIQRSLNPLPDYYLPQSLVASALAGVALLVFEDLSDSATALIVVALAASVAVVVVSATVNRPLDSSVRGWRGAGMPDDYERLRRAWDAGQALRSAAGVIANACYVAAAEQAGEGGFLLALSVVFAAQLAGGMMLVLVVLVLAIRRVGGELGIRLHLGFDHYVDRFLPPFAGLAVLSGAGAIAFHDLDSGAAAVAVAGLVAVVAAALMSHLLNRPINKTLASFEPGTVPPGYAALRTRWDRLHAARTAVALVGLILLAAALLSL
jgi:uncharacterized membrane protein